MLEEVSICIDCFSDTRLKNALISKNHIIPVCDFCKNNNILGATTDDFDFIASPINGYIRFNFDESVYTPKYGGKCPIKIIEENNLFLNFHKIDTESDTYVVLVDAIFNSSNSTSIYTIQDYAIGHALKNGSYYRHLVADNLKYLEVYKDLQTYTNKVKQFIVSKAFDFNTPLFRARVGTKSVTEKNKFLGHKVPKEEAFTGSEISAPKNSLSSGGRANRSGISFLYLAEDEYTAVSEVRAVPGDNVSVGQFKANCKLKVANFINPDIELFWNSDDDMELLCETISFGKLFSHPVGTNGNYKYLSTQILAELLAIEGFDGICYKSFFKKTETEKANYVFFDPSTFDYVENSKKIVRMKDIKLEY